MKRRKNLAMLPPNSKKTITTKSIQKPSYRPPLPARYDTKSQTHIHYCMDHRNEPCKMLIGAYLVYRRQVTLYMIALTSQGETTSSGGSMRFLGYRPPTSVSPQRQRVELASTEPTQGPQLTTFKEANQKLDLQVECATPQ